MNLVLSIVVSLLCVNGLVRAIEFNDVPVTVAWAIMLGIWLRNLGAELFSVSHKG